MPPGQDPSQRASHHELYGAPRRGHQHLAIHHLPADAIAPGSLPAAAFAHWRNHSAAWLSCDLVPHRRHPTGRCRPHLLPRPCRGLDFEAGELERSGTACLIPRGGVAIAD